MTPRYFEFSAPSLEEAVLRAEEGLQIAREDFHYSIVEDVEEQLVLIRVFPEKNKPKSSLQPVSYKPWGALSEETEEVQLLLTFFQKIFSYYEVELRGFYLQEESATECYLDLQCDDPGILIGKGGATLEALRSLASIYLAHQRKGEQFSETKKVFQIDIQGYLRKRFENLKQEIDKVSQKVKSTGKDILLKGEFSPGERRQIHVYAQTIPGIGTESQGDGFLKSVLISFRENDERE